VLLRCPPTTAIFKRSNCFDLSKTKTSAEMVASASPEGSDRLERSLQDLTTPLVLFSILCSNDSLSLKLLDTVPSGLERDVSLDVEESLIDDATDSPLTCEIALTRALVTASSAFDPTPVAVTDTEEIFCAKAASGTASAKAKTPTSTTNEAKKSLTTDVTALDSFKRIPL